ncbi:hypothetical protein ACFV7Q_31510 [Streptomyces sp. NPDC059851]|uniref:hypothetical protein n=1 Tax=Streptomyces sp. NPDC059851 TaxID=3346971 RepID=UPI0036588DC9
MRLRSSLATFTVSVVLLLTATTTASASAVSDAASTGRTGVGNSAPARKDSNQRPVFFIKGYTPGDGDKCGKKWNSAAALFKKSKWKGKLHRVGFYEEDTTGCDVRIDPEGKGTVDTSLKDLVVLC